MTTALAAGQRAHRPTIRGCQGWRAVHTASPGSCGAPSSWQRAQPLRCRQCASSQLLEAAVQQQQQQLGDIGSGTCWAAQEVLAGLADAAIAQPAAAAAAAAAGGSDSGDALLAAAAWALVAVATCASLYAMARAFVEAKAAIKRREDGERRKQQEEDDAAKEKQRRINEMFKRL